eukprot:16540-Heterococcus_DN1.PRE.1
MEKEKHIIQTAKNKETRSMSLVLLQLRANEFGNLAAEHGTALSCALRMLHASNTVESSHHIRPASNHMLNSLQHVQIDEHIEQLKEAAEPSRNVAAIKALDGAWQISVL